MMREVQPSAAKHAGSTSTTLSSVKANMPLDPGIDVECSYKVHRFSTVRGACTYNMIHDFKTYLNYSNNGKSHLITNFQCHVSKKMPRFFFPISQKQNQARYCYSMMQLCPIKLYSIYIYMKTVPVFTILSLKSLNVLGS